MANLRYKNFAMIVSYDPKVGYDFNFVIVFLKGPFSSSLSFIFGLFKHIIQILQQINVKKCPYSIRCRDSNSQPFDYESPLTTRPGLPSELCYYFPLLAAFDSIAFFDANSLPNSVSLETVL